MSEHSKRAAKIEAEQQSRWNRSDASAYDQWRCDRRSEFFDRLYLDLAKNHSPSSVLEIGCGAGHLLQKLEGQIPDCQFRGIDLSRVMVDRAREKGFDAIVGSGNELPYADQEFDMVIAGTWVFKYLDRGKAMAECRRVLRPGGALAFDLPFHPARGLLALCSIVRKNPKIWCEAWKDCYFRLDGRWVPAWKSRLRQSGFEPYQIVGGMQPPFFRSRFGYRGHFRSPLLLPVCEVVWISAIAE